MKRATIVPFLLILSFFILQARTPENQTSSPLYVKGIFYLVFSLSDVDFNRRLNTFHIEPQVELRKGSARGTIVKGAMVKVNGVPLPLVKKKYRVKKILLKHQIPEIQLTISLPSGLLVYREIAIPCWLKLTSPLPAVYDNQDLQVTWIPLRLKLPVRLHAYNLLDGKTILPWLKVTGNKQIIGKELLPKRALVKIDVIEPQFHQVPLKGQDLSAKSEIRLLSRSQVMLRTR